MQTLTVSEKNALPALAMLKNAAKLGIDIGAVYAMVVSSLDESEKSALDQFLIESPETYEFAASRQLAAVPADIRAQVAKLHAQKADLLDQIRKVDEKMAEIASRLSNALTIQNGEIVAAPFRVITAKSGHSTKSREVLEPGHGREPGFIYRPCRFTVVASKATKEANMRGILRRKGNMNGAWNCLVSVDDVRVEIDDLDPRSAVRRAVAECSQRALERGYFTSEQVGFLMHPGAPAAPDRHRISITNVPRDVLGADGSKRLASYVELTGDDAIL